jgi:hypothetical protein
MTDGISRLLRPLRITLLSLANGFSVLTKPLEQDTLPKPYRTCKRLKTPFTSQLGSPRAWLASGTLSLLSKMPLPSKEHVRSKVTITKMTTMARTTTTKMVGSGEATRRRGVE